jgi:hypothetical protein
MIGRFMRAIAAGLGAAADTLDPKPSAPTTSKPVRDPEPEPAPLWAPEYEDDGLGYEPDGTGPMTRWARKQVALIAAAHPWNIELWTQPKTEWTTN